MTSRSPPTPSFRPPRCSWSGAPRRYYAAVSHGLLTRSAVDRLNASPIERLLITNSVETQLVDLPAKVEVVSVAGLFGEAIRRIAQKESISVLFS